MTFSNTRHVSADFIRGGRDDIMFSTTSGAWLYAGAAMPTYLTPNVWSNSGYGMSTTDWFGR